MRIPRPSPLCLGVVLATLPVLSLQAQYSDTTMKKPMTHDMPAAGTIHGTGSHMAAGTIHVVGAMPTQQIHFTSEFKTDVTEDLHAVLSSDMMAGSGSVDLGKVTQGDQLIAVPKTADARHFAQLLLVDGKSKRVVAATTIPGGMMDKKDGTMKSGMAKDTAMAMPMKKDSAMSKPR
jgi:hypothetical protein